MNQIPEDHEFSARMTRRRIRREIHTSNYMIHIRFARISTNPNHYRLCQLISKPKPYQFIIRTPYIPFTSKIPLPKPLFLNQQIIFFNNSSKLFCMNIKMCMKSLGWNQILDSSIFRINMQLNKSITLHSLQSFS